ncbi:hypothetical protein TNCV_3527381 [Trichonephila clavipes]|nr:hypothetical protein TNCV_3527381 [Trichonephila clavipes]
MADGRCTQPKEVIWFCVVVTEYGHPTTEHQISEVQTAFSELPLNSDRVSQYRVALMVPTSKKSSQKGCTPQFEKRWLIVNTVQNDRHVIRLALQERTATSQPMNHEDVTKMLHFIELEEDNFLIDCE